MYRNCTNNSCCYGPCYCCYCNYCCCNPAINACVGRQFVCQAYTGNRKGCSFRRISDMPSKKKSSFDTLEKSKKKKRVECTCNETHMAICKRIQDIDKKMVRCKCMTSDDNPCSNTAPPVVNEGNRNVTKREVYLLPYYGVPIKKNKKYILECTSFESTDASCSETPDSSNNNQNEWCPPLPPECDTNEPMDTACRQLPSFPKSQTGETSFVGRCTSFESLASLQPTKRNSCHCCCSRRANNNKSRRHGSSPIGKSWSQLDVIDEEDMDSTENLPQPVAKKKAKDYTSKTQGNSSKLPSPQKYDTNVNANASANRNAKGNARSNGNGTGYPYGIASCCAPANANANANVRGNAKSNATGYAYGNASCCAPANANANANVRGNAKSNATGYAYGNASCCANASAKDYCNETVETKTVESKMHKSLEDSCADFLNIVTDNILETVQTSVSLTLKDYCAKTSEKIDQAFEKLEQNDVAMRCLCGRLMEKLTEQNERDYEKIVCLLEQLKESQQSKQNSIEKIYMQSRASQYEVAESYGATSPCGFEQPVPPYYAPQSSYVRESMTVLTTNPDSVFRACCAQQSVTPPQSLPESAGASVNCYGQNENLENGNGKNGNGQNGNGKNGNGENGNGKNGNGKNGNEQNGKAPDDIIVNEVLPNENENQEVVGKVIIPPCRCCHKCTCTPKPTYTGPPRPNIYLETDEKKKSISREYGGSSDQYDEEGGEETLSPSRYHIVSDKCKPKANVLENKTSLNDSTKSGVRACNSNSAARTESTSGMFTTFSMKSSQKTVFQSKTDNSTADIPATSGKDKNTPELDLYGNYDTSGYATEPEDNNDGIDGNSARKTSADEQQFLPVTLQYVRNNPATKTGTTNRNTTTKKHSKKRTTSTSKSPSSRLFRL